LGKDTKTAEIKLKAGELFGAVRTAVSGQISTPLFQMMAVLGERHTSAHIDDARIRLNRM
jgi:hypothetical protein